MPPPSGEARVLEALDEISPTIPSKSLRRVERSSQILQRFDELLASLGLPPDFDGLSYDEAKGSVGERARASTLVIRRARASRGPTSQARAIADTPFIRATPAWGGPPPTRPPAAAEPPRAPSPADSAARSPPEALSAASSFSSESDRSLTFEEDGVFF